MAIDVNKITTEITLELDEEVISIADYQKASQSFLNLVKEVTKSSTSTKDNASIAAAWQIRIYAGSVGLGVVHNGGFNDSDVVKNIIIRALKQLSKGDRPLEFTDRAIEHAKNLASVYKKNISPKIRVWAGQTESVLIDKNIRETADFLLLPAYEEDSSVEGMLQNIDSHNGLKVAVYDVIDGRSVSCEIPDDKLQIAIANFNKRVEVIGRVKYKRDGMPVSVEVSKIVPFPDPEDIPSLERMRLLLSGKATA